MEGWSVDVPHFVERHSLILIIALGESIVAIGAGATHDVDTRLAIGALLAITVAGGLWWAYFTGEADRTSVGFARLFEQPAFLDALVRELAGKFERDERVGFPAVLGAVEPYGEAAEVPGLGQERLRLLRVMG